MRWAAIVVSALLLVVPVRDASQASSETQQPVMPAPNVLLIVTDDQRADTMEAMPSTSQFFAERGRYYPNAFATTPLCCPSRASVFTGLYAHNHNVKTQSRSAPTLDPALTLLRYLGDRNYYSGLIGKWLNGWQLEVTPPYLDEVAMFTSSAMSYSDAQWNVDGTVRSIPGYSTDFMTRRATGFIRRAETQDDVPWFLVITPPQPHSPFEAQPQFADLRVSEWNPQPNVGEVDKADKPPWIETKGAGRYRGRILRKKQLRTLASVDDMVSKTFSALKESGEAANTLAFFTSDNGYLWGDHGIIDMKRFPYTASVNVPLYVRWPGHIASGETDDRLAATVDIAPTILEAVGDVERSQQLDGRSLLQPSSRQRILLEYWRGDGHALDTWAALRTREYQYVEYYDANNTVIYREYYDLIEDPYQLENLLDNGTPLDDPEWVSLSLELSEMRECTGPSCP